MEERTKEEARWSETKSLINTSIGDDRIVLGPYFSYIIKNTPRRLLHLLSYYKFAAKMIGPQQTVLEVGCSEGLGTVILAECARACIGIDLDQDAIQTAQKTFATSKLEFRHADVLAETIGQFDAVVNFDVIEHIYPENEEQFLSQLASQLVSDGMCIIGTPNITSDQYASTVTKAGHVNLYSADRLRASLGRHFKRVMLFSANDETIHTGFSPLAHYLIGIGVCKKEMI